MNTKITNIKKEKINTIKLKDLIGESKIKIKLMDHYHSDLELDIKVELSNILDDNKITCNNAELRYDLSYSQGSGLSWIGSGKFIHNKQIYFFNISLGNNSNYYSHKYTTSIEISTNHGNSAKKEIYEYFKELYYNICDELEKFGYESIRLREIKDYKISLGAELFNKYDIEDDFDFEYLYLILTDDEYNALTEDEKKNYIQFTDKSEVCFELYIKNISIEKYFNKEIHEFITHKLEMML